MKTKNIIAAIVLLFSVECFGQDTIKFKNDSLMGTRIISAETGQVKRSDDKWVTPEYGLWIGDVWLREEEVVELYKRLERLLTFIEQQPEYKKHLKKIKHENK